MIFIKIAIATAVFIVAGAVAVLADAWLMRRRGR